VITLTLPYPISANRYWATRIVTPKGGKPMAMTYVTPEAKQYKEAVGWLLRAAGVKQPMKGRMQVDIKLYPHRPLDWAKRARLDPLYWADTVQRLDLDNARKVLNDALKDIAFGDDKCIWKDSGEVMEPDGRDACLVVTITPIVLAQPQVGLGLDEPVQPKQEAAEAPLPF
jgi:crossover junction endodeoxyribonuclease RusA